MKKSIKYIALFTLITCQVAAAEPLMFFRTADGHWSFLTPAPKPLKTPPPVAKEAPKKSLITFDKTSLLAALAKLNAARAKAGISIK